MDRTFITRGLRRQEAYQSGKEVTALKSWARQVYGLHASVRSSSGAFKVTMNSRQKFAGASNELLVVTAASSFVVGRNGTENVLDYISYKSILYRPSRVCVGGLVGTGSHLECVPVVCLRW